MSETRLVGDILYLSHEVGEDLPTQFVSAYLYNQNDTFIKRVDLNYVANGLFTENAELMPDVAKLKVIYKVFFDAPRANVDDEFPFKSECYTPPGPLGVVELEPATQEQLDRIESQVEANSANAPLLGIVPEDFELVGVLLDDGAYANLVDDTEIVGTI